MVTPTVQIGPHRLYLGYAGELLPELTAVDKFDALCMDPPYVMKTAGGGNYRKTRQTMDDIRKADLDQGFDLNILSWKFAEAIFCFCSDDQLHHVKARLKAGFNRAVTCAWHKPNAQPVANKHYQPDTEFYVHAWMLGFYPQGELADKKRYLVSPIVKNKFNHPTVKPDAVMDKIMINMAGETVCDPFAGTGSTGVAAIKQGKIFTGIEKSEQHFETMVKRITQAVAA